MKYEIVLLVLISAVQDSYQSVIIILLRDYIYNTMELHIHLLAQCNLLWKTHLQIQSKVFELNIWHGTMGKQFKNQS